MRPSKLGSFEPVVILGLGLVFSLLAGIFGFGESVIVGYFILGGLMGLTICSFFYEEE